MMTTTTKPARDYERHAAAADRGAWSVERDVAWHAIDATLAYRTPDVLAALRDAVVIESFHPVNLARLMRATWDDVDAGVAFSLEAYEGFRHFHSLRRYLETIGYEPAVTDEELVAARRAGADLSIEPDELIERLVEFMLSEHLAAYFFRRLAAQAQEPELAKLLDLIAADEVRHAQSASDLIAKRIRQSTVDGRQSTVDGRRSTVDSGQSPVALRVLRAAADFRHYGDEVVGHVPVAMRGDDIAIRTFAQRIERLCGMRLVDYLKQSL